MPRLLVPNTAHSTHSTQRTFIQQLPSGTRSPRCEVWMKFTSSVCDAMPVPAGWRAKNTSRVGAVGFWFLVFGFGFGLGLVFGLVGGTQGFRADTKRHWCSLGQLGATNHSTPKQPNSGRRQPKQPTVCRLQHPLDSGEVLHIVLGPPAPVLQHEGAPVGAVRNRIRAGRRDPFGVWRVWGLRGVEGCLVDARLGSGLRGSRSTNACCNHYRYHKRTPTTAKATYSPQQQPLSRRRRPRSPHGAPRRLQRSRILRHHALKLGDDLIGRPLHLRQPLVAGAVHVWEGGRRLRDAVDVAGAPLHADPGPLFVELGLAAQPPEALEDSGGGAVAGEDGLEGLVDGEVQLVGFGRVLGGAGAGAAGRGRVGWGGCGCGCGDGGGSANGGAAAAAAGAPCERSGCCCCCCRSGGGAKDQRPVCGWWQGDCIALRGGCC